MDKHQKKREAKKARRKKDSLRRRKIAIRAKGKHTPGPWHSGSDRI